MLVLQRNEGQRIVINGNIIVTLIAIRNGHRAKIGIEAPPDVPVLREELIGMPKNNGEQPE